MFRCVALTVLALALQASAQNVCRSDTCQNNGVCVIVTGSPSCACPLGISGDRCENGGAPSTVAAPAVTGPPCGQTVFDGCEKADVVFLMSYSRYDDSDDIDHEGDFVKGIIGELQVDPDHVRVGVVVYHDTVREAIHLDDYAGDVTGLTNRVEVLTGARSQSHLNPSGLPSLSKALAYAKDVSFQRARPDAKKVVISIVHRLGATYNDYGPIIQAANELKADCVHLFVEAVERNRYEQTPYGGQSTSLLQQVASSPTNPFYTKYDSFTDLENAAQRFNVNCPNSG